MKKHYHAPIEVNGHMLMVDIPWFLSKEEYIAWYKDLEEWDKKEQKKE